MARCSYCYVDGHNRRTCPDYTKRLEKHAESGSEYYKQMLADRGKGKDKSQRTCSFCSTRGHDRRKCEQLGAYVDKRSALDLAARIDFAGKISDAGLGIGALVSFKVKEYDYSKSEYITSQNTGVICNIRWDMLDNESYDSTSQFITVESIELQDDGSYTPRKRHLSMPFDVVAKEMQNNREEVMSSSRWDCAPVVVSPVENCSPPAGTFYNKKKIDRRIRNHAKDFKHYSWQVREVVEQE